MIRTAARNQKTRPPIMTLTRNSSCQRRMIKRSSDSWPCPAGELALLGWDGSDNLDGSESSEYHSSAMERGPNPAISSAVELDCNPAIVSLYCALALGLESESCRTRG